MQSESITFKNMVILAAIGIATGWLAAAMMGGAETTTIGIVTVALIETLFKAAVYFAGFGVGRFRARGSKADDIRDTFS
jgi:hypothetical protein